MNLTDKKVGPMRIVKEGQATLAMPEFFGAIDAALSDPEVQEALQRRGIADFKKLTCAPRTIGNFGREEEKTRRLVKLDCFDLSKEETNTLTTPIEGLYIKVDVDEKEVLEVIDTGVVLIPPGQGLPAWTKKGRNLDGEDIVLWYTMGFHHVPSAEDWPAYNVGWHAVTLAPYNFFDQNPAMDLPPQAE